MSLDLPPKTIQGEVVSSTRQTLGSSGMAYQLRHQAEDERESRYQAVNTTMNTVPSAVRKLAVEMTLAVHTQCTLSQHSLVHPATYCAYEMAQSLHLALSCCECSVLCFSRQYKWRR